MHFLVLQHIACEHPGVLRDFMREDGTTWDAVELDRGDAIPSLDAYDALVVMGGPMDVWDEAEHPWLVDEKRYIREAVEQRKLPYLGLCLGHQLLADALGGRVEPMATPEVGILSVELAQAAEGDRLFAGVPERSAALQWHSAEVTKPPEGATVLARSELCAIQAFRVGTNAYGIQYHVELTQATVPEWGCVPAYETALEATLGPGSLERLRDEADANMPGFNETARTLYDNFTCVVRAGP
jgi:GMP synthase-like glutamine amidotransferase